MPTQLAAAAERISTGAVAAAMTLVGRPRPLDRLDAALRAVAPHLTDADRAAWVAALQAPMGKAGIATARCVAAFLGQCAVESAGFRVLAENLSYSAARLCQVWPNRFPTLEAAEACAGDPERLANTVYANRLGNGGPETGDGWTFRGHGLIQVTGRSAYERFAAFMGMGVNEAVAHAQTVQGAADSAAWFWSANGLNALAATWSLDNITKRVNGGLLGAAERARLSNAALLAIGV